MSKPTSFKELFEFYYAECKPLHARLSANNSLPVELLLELNAALDHLSRHWQYDQSELEVVSQASGHLKRSTFDAFKLILKETRDHYDALQNVDIYIIDNGQFETRMHALWSEIRRLAMEARIKEGDARNAKNWDQAFDLWKQVHIRCQEFDSEYFISPNVPWAKKVLKRKRIMEHLIGFVIGVVSGVMGNLIFQRYFP